MGIRSEEHTSELQSRLHLVCRLLLEKKKKAEAEPPQDHPATYPGAVRVYGGRRVRRVRAMASRPVPARLTCPHGLLFFFFKDRPPPGFLPFPPHAPFPI